MSKMIRIGCVNIDTSHPLAFAKCLLEGERARYVGVYNDGFRSEREVDAFVEKCGLEKCCASIEELADMCDIGIIQGCNWDLHLKNASAFIDKGKPVFIDKPVVGSLKDCQKLQSLAAKGAAIFGGSSMRYVKEIQHFNSLSESEKGKILHIYGTIGVDEFNYAIHIVEIISQLINAGPEAVKMNFSSSCNGHRCESYTIRFENGVNATYTATHGVWQPWVLVIMTTKGTFHFEIDITNLYQPLMDNICDQMQYGKSSLVPVDKLIESIKILLAGKASRQQNGSEISIGSLPENIGFDGSEFAAGYARTAPSIYI